MGSLSENITAFNTELKGTDCRLVAVSKTKPASLLMEAYELGVRVFGENKVQEMCEKAEALPKDIEWHLIGHLQTNKVKYVASFVALIHAVDSPKLLQEINKQAQKSGRVIPCLLQVYIAREETKFGFDRDELLAFLASPEFASLKNIQIQGLMGMASNTDDAAQVRSEFKGLKKLFEEIKSLYQEKENLLLKELSMGMSGDYKIAVEEGSTMIRVGSAIFGGR